MTIDMQIERLSSRVVELSDQVRKLQILEKEMQSAKERKERRSELLWHILIIVWIEICIGTFALSLFWDHVHK